MAFTYGFYNYKSTDPVDDRKEYDAVQFGEIFDGLISDGILATFGKGFHVKTSEADNQVIIETGRAWLLHTWNFNNADLALNLDSPPLGYERIDAVVIDVDNENRHNEITFVKGEESVSAAKPTLIGWGTDSSNLMHKQFPLAYIHRSSYQDHIDAGDIENAIGVSGTDPSTPYVANLSSPSFSIDTFLSQWIDGMSEWMTKKKNDYDTWFSGLVDNLDSDVAANLQNQINGLKIHDDQTVTLSTVSDTIITFQSPYLDHDYIDPQTGEQIDVKSFIHITCEYVPELPTLTYKKIVVSGDTCKVTFPKYIGTDATPPTFKVRMWLR